MDPSQPYFPVTHKGKKKSKKKDSSTGVFCEFCRIFKNTFFKNISGGCFWRWTRRNQTTTHGIPIEHFSVAGQKLKWGKTKRKISFLYSFKKGNFSLEDGAIAPNVPPHLHHWYFAELYFSVTSSLHSSYKIYTKGG